MFEKLKQLRKLKKQMDSIVIEESSDGVTVKMNGSMQVLELSITDRDNKNLEKNVMKAFNNAVKSVQKRMAKDMMGSGGGLF